MKTYTLKTTSTNIENFARFISDNNIMKGDNIKVELNLDCKYDYVLRHFLFLIFREGISENRKKAGLTPLPKKDYILPSFHNPNAPSFYTDSSFEAALFEDTGVLCTLNGLTV